MGSDFIHIGTILIALCIFGFLIFIHEVGHYTFARIFHVSIREFSIGMGPKLFTKTSGKTGIAYSLRALPIGGFVSMEGEDEDSVDPNAFYQKPVWQRLIITIAGAAMNVLIGILIMSFLVMSEKALATTTIARFADGENSVTYQQGLREGDTIQKIDGVSVHIANDLVYEIMRRGIVPIDVTVERDGETIVLEDVSFPTIQEKGTLFGNVDFMVTGVKTTVGGVLYQSFWRSVSTIKMIWESLIDLMGGRYSMEAVSGPVGVTEALGEAAESGSANLFYMAAVISMNLGVMNLLPLPALDGGRLLFLLIELVRRKPIRREVEGYIHFAGFVLLMILFVVITCKDIMALF